MKIFTDGAAQKNGKVDCVCGIGLFSECETIKVGMSLMECRAKWDWLPKNVKDSNNVGELLAIYAAIVLSDSPDIIIYTDSAYSIGCLTKWYKSWEKNGWKTAKKEQVKNKEIIQEILLEKAKKGSVFFFHVNSHLAEPIDKSSEQHKLWYGNYMADKLATGSITKE
jgi:ribonuclease HI